MDSTNLQYKLDCCWSKQNHQSLADRIFYDAFEKVDHTQIEFRSLDHYFLAEKNISFFTFLYKVEISFSRT